MLTIIIKPTEYYNETDNKFVKASNGYTLSLEHSLVSISKWESKWHIAFLGTKEKTSEQLLDYIKCMTLTQNVPDEAYNRLTAENIKQINAYIADSRTATIINEKQNATGSRAISKNNNTVTSELIYYWMVANQIPMECQKWHLNRLLTLIRICNIKNNPDKGKKMSKKDMLSRNRALNAARRKSIGTRG